MATDVLSTPGVGDGIIENNGSVLVFWKLGRNNLLDAQPTLDLIWRQGGTKEDTSPLTKPSSAEGFAAALAVS